MSRLSKRLEALDPERRELVFLLLRPDFALPAVPPPVPAAPPPARVEAQALDAASALELLARLEELSESEVDALLGDARLAGDAPGAPAADAVGDEDDPAELLARLDELGDEQVDRLLQRLLPGEGG